MKLQNKFLQIDSRKVNFICGGLGEPVILLHGFPSGFKTNNKILTEFSKKFKVYGINLPGFGYSDKLKDNMSIKDYVDFIDRFTDKMKISKFRLVGISYGGMLSLKYTANYPEKVKKLLVVSPPFQTSRLSFSLQNLVKSFIWLYENFNFIDNLASYIIRNDVFMPFLQKLIVGNNDKRDYINNIEALRKIKTIDFVKLIKNLLYLDLRNDCSNIKTKTFIMIGLRDRWINEKSGIELSNLIKNSVLVKVDAEHYNIIKTFSEKKLVELFKN